MRSSVRKLGAAALAGLAALALVAPVQAQVGARMPGATGVVTPRVGPGPAQAPVGGGFNPYVPARAATLGSVGYNPYLGPGASITNTTISSPSTDQSGYGGYYNPYTYNYDPFGGYLRGVADLTRANGRFQIDWQSARLLNQSVEQAKIETRRRLYDEWRYERMNTPTLEEIRDRNREQALLRARKQPPLTEILSGRSLNDLFNHARAAQAKGNGGPTLKLTPELLKKINVNSSSGGNIGLVKSLGQAESKDLVWPLGLRGNAFEDDRNDLNRKFKQAVNSARTNGRVDAETLQQIDKRIEAMTDRLERSVGDVAVSQYMEAKRYLGLLEDANKALQDPNVSNYFNSEYEAQGKTVGELIEYMSKKGLKFAAATPGDEAAYRALHTLLATYDSGITESATASNK